MYLHIRTRSYTLWLRDLDAKCLSLQCPRVLAVLLPIARWLHFVGFALAIGSAAALTIMRRMVRQKSGAERAILENALAEVVSKIELPGLAIALVGGLIGVVANPTVLDPKVSGVWFFVKMPMVFALFACAFVKMVDAQKTTSERAHGAKDAELDPIMQRGAKLDIASIVLGGAIIFVTLFRFALFM